MKKGKGILSYIYAILSILLVWYIIHVALDSFVVPNPFEVIKEFFRILGTDLIKHLGASTYRLLVALTLTTVLGYVIGLSIGISRRVNKVFSPILYLIFPIPRIAFLPVFMILFGLGDLSKIVLIIAIAVFQVILSTRDGVLEVPKDLILSASSLHLSKWDLIKEIYIPATLPKLFTSLRIALGSSMAALFFAENYATKLGIGYFIMNSWVQVNYVKMYCGIIAVSMLGIIIFKLIDGAEKIICKWRFL
ncbi:MAG: ABC transporter permease [Clostridium sp.]